MWSYLKFRKGLGQYGEFNFTQFINPALPIYPGPLWHKHVHDWLTPESRPENVQVLLIRYEDMLVNATRELLRAAAFVGLPTDHARITWAVEQSAASSMRKIEQTKGAGFFEKKYSKGIRSDFKFVQGASLGGWRAHFTEEDKRLFKSYAGTTLIEHGYADDMDW